MNHGVQNMQSVHQPSFGNNIFASFFGDSKPSYGQSYPSQGHHHHAPSQGHHHYAPSQGHSHSYNPLSNFFGGSSYPYYTSSPYHSHGYGHCHRYPLHPYLKNTNVSFDDNANILGQNNRNQNFIFLILRFCV